MQLQAQTAHGWQRRRANRCSGCSGSTSLQPRRTSPAELSASRMAVHRLRSGAVVIDDAYNANPTSMVAALDALVAMPAVRRVAVLGLMAELDEAAAAHRAVADRLGERGIELIAVGTDLYGVEPHTDPIAAVGQLDQGTVVLVKASRSPASSESPPCSSSTSREPAAGAATVTP